MDILFLDMDGVLNSDDFITQWIESHGDSDASMEQFKRLYFIHDGIEGYVVPELADRLGTICLRTGCRIVWSSSWRENYWTLDPDTGDGRFDWHAIAELWRAKGLPLQCLIGCTPCLDSSRFSYVPRGVEVQSWIDQNSERYNIGRVAILDDNDDAIVGVEYGDARFFQTELEHGLTAGIASEIVEYFSDFNSHPRNPTKSDIQWMNISY